MKFYRLKAAIPPKVSITKPRSLTNKNMNPINLTKFLGPKTTAQSQASGRLKTSVSQAKKKIIKGAIKKVKL